MTTARVAVLGCSGFIGAAVSEALVSSGATVIPVRAPRLLSRARGGDALRAELRDPGILFEVERLRGQLAGCSVVVNAAGVAVATAGGGDALVGANALLPGVVALASPSGARLVHVSSAAVQGRRPVLDESPAVEPFSPYSASKVWGEALVQDRAGDTVCYRPTSVHGRGRSTTRSLVRVLHSPFASVAGEGDRPTPQALLPNVAAAVSCVATSDELPPAVVLHPWEGLTTAELVRVLGEREPRHVPDRVASGVVSAAHRLGGSFGPAAGVARRLEMMWFGQRQVPGWLDRRWSPSHGLEAWKELR